MIQASYAVLQQLLSNSYSYRQALSVNSFKNYIQNAICKAKDLLIVTDIGREKCSIVEQPGK